MRASTTVVAMFGAEVATLDAASVLVSADTLHIILSALDSWQWQASCVCKAWHIAWAETKSLRRGLRLHEAVKLEVPNDWNDGHSMMASAAAGLLCIGFWEEHCVHVYSLSSAGELSQLPTINVPIALDMNKLAMSSASIYVAGRVQLDDEEFAPAPALVYRLKLADGSELASYRDATAAIIEPPYGSSLFTSLSLDPQCKILFALIHQSWNPEPENPDRDHETPDMLIALDATTLIMRFQTVLDYCGCEIVAGNDVLYLIGCAHGADGKPGKRSLRLHALTGEPLKEIQDDWIADPWYPDLLSFVGNRLYVHRSKRRGPETVRADDSSECHICVLSAKGKLLHVHKARGRRLAVIYSMMPCGGSLVLDSDPDGQENSNDPDEGLYVVPGA
jgi:hypothetical protein